MLFVVQVSSDGLFMFCGFGQKVKVMELETGKMKCAIGQVNWSSALIIVLNSWLMLFVCTCIYIYILSEMRWGQRFVHLEKCKRYCSVLSFVF